MGERKRTFQYELILWAGISLVEISIFISHPSILAAIVVLLCILNFGLRLFYDIKDHNEDSSKINDDGTIEVKAKELYFGAAIPTRGSEQAAGYDLYAWGLYGECAVIQPHETRMIGTGIAIEIPDGYFGGIYARSGLASKKGLRPANCTGVIDSDYRGEIKVALHNDSEMPQMVSDGDRIAQLIIQPYLPVRFETVDSLDETERGEGGFGHTGV